MEQQELNILIEKANNGDTKSALALAKHFFDYKEAEGINNAGIWSDKIIKSEYRITDGVLAYLMLKTYYYINGKFVQAIFSAICGYDLNGLFYVSNMCDEIRQMVLDVLSQEKVMSQIQNEVYNGNSDAQYVMGRLYHEGWIVDKDYNKAYLLYEKAAQQGHDKAQFDLGMFCLGVIKEGYAYFVDYKEEQRFINYDLAYSMFLNSAKQGNVFAYLAMGHWKLSQWKEYSSHKKDILLWINKAKDREAPLASFLLYKEYNKSYSDFNLACDYWATAIGGNCPDALDEIGSSFLSREPLELKNIETAENYYDKIYKSGCHRQYFRHLWNLGCCFSKLKQFDKFLLWASRASECDRSQNYMLALIKLAKIYLYDYQKYDVEQDIKKSKEYCLKAINPGVEIQELNIDYVKSAKELLPLIELFEKAQVGDAEAQYRVANLYYLGENENIKKDTEIAKQWLLKSAQNGYIESYYELAKRLFFDEVEVETALEYCQKAAEKGHKDAQVFLPVIQNFVLANKGDATAQCHVGMYYEEGNEFIKQNLEKAESWYKKAMLNGNQNAAVLLSGVQMKQNNIQSEAQRKAMEKMKREIESMREESERNREAAEESLAEARRSREEAENTHRKELDKIREEAENARRDREAAERERKNAANDLRQAQQERENAERTEQETQRPKKIEVKISYRTGQFLPEYKRSYEEEMSEDLYNKLSMASIYEVRSFLKNRGELIYDDYCFDVDSVEIV